MVRHHVLIICLAHRVCVYQGLSCAPQSCQAGRHGRAVQGLRAQGFTTRSWWRSLVVGWVTVFLWRSLRLTMNGQWWKHCLQCSGTISALPMFDWFMFLSLPMQEIFAWCSFVRSPSTGGSLVPFSRRQSNFFSDRGLIVSHLQLLDHYSVSDYSHGYHLVIYQMTSSLLGVHSDRIHLNTTVLDHPYILLPFPMQATPNAYSTLLRSIWSSLLPLSRGRPSWFES